MEMKLEVKESPVVELLLYVYEARCPVCRSRVDVRSEWNGGVHTLRLTACPHLAERLQELCRAAADSARLSEVEQ